MVLLMRISNPFASISIVCELSTNHERLSQPIMKIGIGFSTF